MFIRQQLKERQEEEILSLRAEKEMEEEEDYNQEREVEVGKQEEEGARETPADN
jgi:hypothetical protein